MAFLSRSKHLLISWLYSLSTVILEPKKIKSVTISTFSPIYLPWSDGTRCHGPSFLNVEFSLSSFIKRLFSSSSLSANKVESFAIKVVYLRLLVFLLAILIPAYVSSNPIFHRMYSAYMFNKMSNNIKPWCTPFPILFFFNFYFYFILLYNTALILPYIDMNPPWVYMHSQTWTPLPHPSP